MYGQKEIENKITEITEFAKDMIFKEGKEFEPMCEVVAVDQSDGKVTSLVFLFAGEEVVEQRRKVLFKIGRDFASGNNMGGKKLSPMAMFFMSEAWMSKAPKDTPEDQMPRPSLDPNREEIFSVTASNSRRENFCKMFYIKRENDDIRIDPIPGNFDKMESALHDSFWAGYYSRVKAV